MLAKRPGGRVVSSTLPASLIKFKGKREGATVHIVYQGNINIAHKTEWCSMPSICVGCSLNSLFGGYRIVDAFYER